MFEIMSSDSYGLSVISLPDSCNSSKGEFLWPHVLPKESEPWIRRKGLPITKAKEEMNIWNNLKGFENKGKEMTNKISNQYQNRPKEQKYDQT